jgi:hypothetical protein
MKRQLKWSQLVSVALVLSLSVLTACDKDNPTGGDDVDVGTLRATVNGTAMDFSSGVSSSESPLDPAWYMVAGSDPDNSSSIVMNIPGETGSYDFGGQDGPVMVINVDNLDWVAISGTLNISTSSDSNLAGAFSGTLTDNQLNTIGVDGGVFNVEIVQLHQ